ncbi:MAG: hypothetical protein MIO93_09880 [ANME-2 cluster archaeon]|nr:hypothetical protein [ANME-2 cluster archaeon]
MELFDFFKSKPKSKTVAMNEMIIEKTQEESEPICPYCGGVLEKKPQRKKKCPLCGKGGIHLTPETSIL